jgi:hypothetical protein
MDWCVKDFQEVNHAPVVRIQGDRLRNVKPGDKVTLAAAATDPDNDRLAYKWWQYTDAGSAKDTVTITNSDSPEHAGFVIPDEPGRQIHIILEVTDNGTPSLVGYQRIVFDIQ